MQNFVIEFDITQAKDPVTVYTDVFKYLTENKISYKRTLGRKKDVNASIDSADLFTFDDEISALLFATVFSPYTSLI